MEIARARIEALDDVLAEVGDVRWSTFEDVLAGRAWLIGVFPDEAAARAGWESLRANLPPAIAETPVWRELADVDWRESYKAHFKAWRCGRLHWIPEWERATRRGPRGDAAVYLDPGLAFGTGNHETTRLCCRRLVEYARGLTPRARREWRVIDAGCGSGILAISAAKLGCRYVFAFDVDPEAVAIARENARRNQVGAIVRAATGGVEERLARRRADLVLANIQADVLLVHAATLLRTVTPGGWLVLSGILATELADVRRGFLTAAGQGWRVSSRVRGEWSDLVLRAPAADRKKERRPARGRLSR
jgi:ribosomal protein L11 methyltransferase